LGVGVVNLIGRTELVSGETVVTICVAVSRAEIVEKFNTGTERESKRRTERGQSS
jgi:hypothetical protein